MILMTLLTFSPEHIAHQHEASLSPTQRKTRSKRRFEPCQRFWFSTVPLPTRSLFHRYLVDVLPSTFRSLNAGMPPCIWQKTVWGSVPQCVALQALWLGVGPRSITSHKMVSHSGSGGAHLKVFLLGGKSLGLKRRQWKQNLS